MFWAKAINTTAYLINRSPLALLNCKILEEIWSSKELKNFHLKVFGCFSYVHIDLVSRNKLDSKFEIYFFISYGDIKLDYHFWYDENHKIVRSKDVIFNESMMYKDKLEKNIQSANSKTNESKMVHLKDFSMVESQEDEEI